MQDKNLVIHSLLESLERSHAGLLRVDMKKTLSKNVETTSVADHFIIAYMEGKNALLSPCSMHCPLKDIAIFPD